MNIRKAQEKDCPRLLELLDEIGKFHHAGRPDIFRADAGKHSLTDLSKMLTDLSKPIFVAVDEKDAVVGYAMCEIKENAEHPVLAPYKMLYLDDLCVAENARVHGLGAQLMDYCKAFAKAENCSRMELNVWEFPGSALEFYEKQGFRNQRRELEFWL
ncbi:GNAT family N-acetyltransferase [Lactococcus nasutitermitis]|uniref:GNAT family N-acetyltransferase n=1 Tax=Lactococcus nasutitermitis TaxID=1652957 RepID=A0ABV9JFA2_9LACT|nr:GNAT family N-acetyltransferase [Lactococcus nasutitermitis]